MAQLVKESACNAEDLGSIPGLGRSPGEGKGYPLQYSGLENSMGGIVHGVAKSQTQLSDFHFHVVGGGGWYTPETMVQGKEAGFGLTSTSKVNVRMMNPAGRGLCMTPGSSATASLLCLANERTHVSLQKEPPCSVGIQYSREKQAPDSRATLCPWSTH